ncbi:hypothetical protein QQS21_005815 [Conoideocrella luteorostrata]|uniref:Uncharacterized protein n=1 Tax=Conoideocrella luteorostrata TaxID=1105319 RepID=A0AAJ0CNW6_9HYPO|nr:hypothetical protein QQS21_005815 [Conoideocrella luteorostrata]
MTTIKTGIRCASIFRHCGGHTDDTSNNTNRNDHILTVHNDDDDCTAASSTPSSDGDNGDTSYDYTTSATGVRPTTVEHATESLLDLINITIKSMGTYDDVIPPMAGNIDPNMVVTLLREFSNNLYIRC